MTTRSIEVRDLTDPKTNPEPKPQNIDEAVAAFEIAWLVLFGDISEFIDDEQTVHIPDEPTTFVFPANVQ